MILTPGQYPQWNLAILVSYNYCWTARYSRTYATRDVNETQNFPVPNFTPDPGNRFIHQSVAVVPASDMIDRQLV